MENYKLVLRGDLNQNGYLYGGNLLKWVDEFAWIAATLDFPDCSFVTIAMDDVVFKKSIKEGTILKFKIEQSAIGNTSANYSVHVFCLGNKINNSLVFTTSVTFVRIDSQGNKLRITQ